MLKLYVFIFRNFIILLNTFLRLLTSAINDAQGRLFSNAKPDTLYEKIYQNNMDENSFDGSVKRIIEKALSNPKTAIFQSTLIWSDKKYSCKVW